MKFFPKNINNNNLKNKNIYINLLIISPMINKYICFNSKITITVINNNINL